MNINKYSVSARSFKTLELSGARWVILNYLSGKLLPFILWTQIKTNTITYIGLQMYFGNSKSNRKAPNFLKLVMLLKNNLTWGSKVSVDNSSTILDSLASTWRDGSSVYFQKCKMKSCKLQSLIFLK